MLRSGMLHVTVPTPFRGRPGAEGVARLEHCQSDRSLFISSLWGSAFRRLSPYTYNIFLLGLIPLALYLDVHTSSIQQQNWLGLGALIILITATRFSPPAERRQVWIMVGVATCVEVFGSIIWGVYRYRFGNLPLFVPWGHGLVYLFALRAARTPLLLKHGKAATRIAFSCATAWAIFGLTVEPLFMGRVDLLGALWWPIFAWFMRKPAAPIFAAAFFVTSILELFGTHFGNWAWQVHAPVILWPCGNPPSVISAGYCLMDFASLTIAARLPGTFLLPRAVARVRLAAGLGALSPLAPVPETTSPEP